MSQDRDPHDTPADLATDLATATTMVVRVGEAFDTHPYPETTEMLLIEDAAVVQSLVGELASADLTPGVVVPALGG